MRLGELVSKVTKRPSALIEGASLAKALPSTPLASEEASTTAPVSKSLTKTSPLLTVALAVRLVAELTKATNRPSALITSELAAALASRPLASADASVTAPVARFLTKTSCLPSVAWADRLVAVVENATMLPLLLTAACSPAVTKAFAALPLASADTSVSAPVARFFWNSCGWNGFTCGLFSNVTVVPSALMVGPHFLRQAAPRRHPCWPI